MESGGGGSSNSDNNNNNNGSALIAESTGYSKRAGTTTVSSSTSLSRYESQKRRDWNTFGQYLRNHRPPLGLPRCNSAHVLEFLRYLDQFGKTKIHVPGCPFFGQPNPPAPCACPLRQAWGSLDALIGRLRAAFEEHGGQPETNPFGARAVRIFLREVRDLQAKARGITYEKKKRKRPPYPTSLTGVTPPPQPSPQTTTVAMMSSTTSPPLAPPPPPHQACYRPQTTAMTSSTTSSPPHTAVMLTSSVTFPPCLTTAMTSPPLPFLHPQFSHPSLMTSSQQFGVPQFQLPYSYHSHMKLPVGLTRPTHPNQFPW